MLYKLFKKNVLVSSPATPIPTIAKHHWMTSVNFLNSLEDAYTISRFTIVSRKAKKKQAVCDE